jgi:molybdopterin molybdotransferase
MISVQEAKEIILKNTYLLPEIEVPLIDAAFQILTRDTFAITDLPPFNQSAMDGYAINFEAWKNETSLQILGESAAGDPVKKIPVAGFASRIFTGAALPVGTDTVIMQEKCSIQQNKLIINDTNLKKENAVRAQGEEIKKNDLALKKGNLLNAAAIGFLASIGIEKVHTTKMPRVDLIITGNELQTPGQPLKDGQIYESNSFALQAALNASRINDIRIFFCKDNLQSLIAQLSNSLDQADVILLTGGVSVGDYDFVIEASKALQIKQQFHKVRQKPGKPLFFGTKEQQLIFGLPGNPSSVLCCFYEYVIPALNQMNPSIQKLIEIKVPITDSYKKNTNLTHFLKAKYNGTTVTPLKAQESYRLSSFALADALICIDETTTDVQAGDLIDVHLLS